MPHSALMFAALMMGRHFSFRICGRRQGACGVCCSGDGITARPAKSPIDNVNLTSPLALSSISGVMRRASRWDEDAGTARAQLRQGRRSNHARPIGKFGNHSDARSCPRRLDRLTERDCHHSQLSACMCACRTKCRTRDRGRKFRTGCASPGEMACP